MFFIVKYENEQFLVLLGPIMSRFFACSNEEKLIQTTKNACSSRISMISSSLTPGNTKGGSITVPLTSCLTGLESAVWQLTIFAFICKTD